MRRVQKVVIVRLTINRTPLNQSDLSNFAPLTITFIISISQPTIDTKTDKGITKKVSHEAFGKPLKEVKIEGLTVDTEYKVRVRARNAVGDGQWSEDVITRTGKFFSISFAR